MNTISRAGTLAVLVVAAAAATGGVAAAAPAPAIPPAVVDAAESPSTPNDLDRSAAIDNAVGAVSNAFNNGANDGKLFGGALGAAVGCPVGAITGGTLTVLTTAGTLTPIGIVGGCLLGGVTGGGLGTLVGGAITGIPPLVATATEQYNQLHAKGFVSAPLPAKYTTAGTTVTALTAVAVALGAGSAHADAPAADPGTVGVQVAPGVRFTGSTTDNSSMLSTPIGVVTMHDGQISVQNATRQQVFGTPQKTLAGDPAAPASVAVAAPAAPAATGDVLGDVHTAWQQAGAYTGLAAGIGGMAGGFAGAAVGCPVGAVTLGSMVTVMSAAALTVPGMIGGCMAGGAMGAAVGGMLGAGAVGIPVGVAVTVDKYNRMQTQRAASPRG